MIVTEMYPPSTDGVLPRKSRDLSIEKEQLERDLPAESGFRLKQRASFVQLAIGLLLLSVVLGCGKSGKETATGESIVLTDPKAGTFFTAPSGTPTPAIHPETGKPTLVRAMYCSKCQTWHPVPPLEVLQRNAKARSCRKTGTPLQLTGPIPADARQID